MILYYYTNIRLNILMRKYKEIAIYQLFQVNVLFNFRAKFICFIQVSQVQKLMKLKELSLPTVAEELRQ